MTIVYAETNLVLELALGQEQCDSCQQLVDWASEQRLELRIPAYAWYEAQAAVRRKQQERSALKKSIELQMREFGRMRVFNDLVPAFETALPALTKANDEETSLFLRVMLSLARVASFIPLDHKAASLVDVFREFRVSGGDPDLLIFSSVMSNLRDRHDNGDVEPSIFVTRNARDFTSRARHLLRQYSCDLFTSYDAAVGRLRTLLA